MITDCVYTYEEYLEAMEEDQETPAIDKITNSMNVAIIEINPRENPAIVSLSQEIIKLSNYAAFRIIKCDADISPATDDLALISKLKKAIKEHQDKYVNPIKAHLDKVQFVFKDLLACLDDVDKTNRGKITAYRDEQARRAAEAAEINRKKEELAMQEAAFNGTGEVTTNTTPVEAAPVINKVSTKTGTSSFKDNWTWELEDIAKVPDEFKILDRAMVTRRVKAGERNISGIRIFNKETLQVRPK